MKKMFAFVLSLMLMLTFISVKASKKEDIIETYFIRLFSRLMSEPNDAFDLVYNEAGNTFYIYYMYPEIKEIAGTADFEAWCRDLYDSFEKYIRMSGDYKTVLLIGSSIEEPAFKIYQSELAMFVVDLVNATFEDNSSTMNP